MSEVELELRYRPEDEWHGQLEAVVRTGAFSGRSAAWFDVQRLKGFVPALRAFPFSADAPPLIEGGYWSKERPGNLEQCHLRVAVRPYNSRGTLLVHVELATQYGTSPDADLHQSVTVRFLTEYAAVEEFAGNLEQMLDGNLESAVLSGTTQ